MNGFLMFFIVCVALTCALALFFLLYCNYIVSYSITDTGIRANRDYEPFVSVIIPTYNEELMIGNKLKNTFELDYPVEKREIILVDSASTDNTVNIARNFDPLIIITEKERKGKAHALAEAFRKAKGELLLVTDADAMLRKDVLEKTVPYFADPAIGAATGKLSLIGEKSNSRMSEEAYKNFFDFLRASESRISSTMVFNGPLMMFRASVIDPPSTDSVADDTEMAFQVIRNGYRAIYVPDAVFFERVPANNEVRLAQKERRAQGLVQSFVRHRDMLFSGRYGLFGKVIFPAEFIVHVILPFALAITLFSMIISFLYEPVKTSVVSIIAGIIILPFAVNVYRKAGQSTGTKLNINNLTVTVFSFIQLEFALFKGAVRLLLCGSSYKWEQIKEARAEDVPSE